MKNIRGLTLVRHFSWRTDSFSLGANGKFRKLRPVSSEFGRNLHPSFFGPIGKIRRLSPNAAETIFICIIFYCQTLKNALILLDDSGTKGFSQYFITCLCMILLLEGSIAVLMAV
jgi:hypothetical protein